MCLRHVGHVASRGNHGVDEARCHVHIENSEAPEILEYQIPPAGSRLVLSLPVWRAESTDETPYQLMQLCDQEGTCETLADLRGTPGMSVASDPSLAMSPDGLYVIVLRHVSVDPSRRTIRATTYELYGVGERGPVRLPHRERDSGDRGQHTWVGTRHRARVEDIDGK